MAAGGGCRLDPGAGLALAAPTRALSFGQPLHRYERVETTQSIARELADAGSPDGTTVVAEEQTAGRGRLGNGFVSPRGGLYVSIVLRPELRLAHIPIIGIAAGLALAEAVAAETGLRPVLKWPNDLLVNGRKLSGLLVELTAGGKVAILGFGVNVNIPAAAFPPELRDTATSLLGELGREIALDGLLGKTLSTLEVRCHQLQQDGPPPLIQAWREAPNFLGQPVRASSGGDVLEGFAADLAEDGALLLRLADGQFRRVVAADVHLLRR